MAQDNFELITMAYAGVEKELDWPFVITAGQNLKAEVGEDELAEVVPAGKKWYGKMQIFIREADA